MSLTTFLLIKAIISLIFGVPLVVLPGILMGLYGITLDPAGILMARYFGAALIGIGLLCLWTRKVADRGAQFGVTTALFVADTLGFVIALLAQFGPVATPLHWVNVIIWLLLALGLAYFRFMALKPG